MIVLETGKTYEFSDFKEYMQDKISKEDYIKFEASIVTKNYYSNDERWKANDFINEWTSITVYKYFSDKQTKFFYFTEIVFVFTEKVFKRYVPNYNVRHILTDEEPNDENIKNMINKDLKEGDII